MVRPSLYMMLQSIMDREVGNWNYYLCMPSSFTFTTLPRTIAEEGFLILSFEADLKILWAVVFLLQASIYCLWRELDVEMYVGAGRVACF